MSTFEMSALSQTALTKLQQLQERLTPHLRYQIEFDFNQRRALYISDEGSLSEVFFVPVCSLGLKSKTLQWAWVIDEFNLPDAYGKQVFDTLAHQTDSNIFLDTGLMTLTEEEMRSALALLVDETDSLGLLSWQYQDTLWSFLITRVDRNIELNRLTEERWLELLFDFLEQDNVLMFNQLREKLPGLRVDLTGKDLRGEAQPWKGDLHAQMLFDYGILAEHNARNLEGINFSLCRLDSAILRGLNLKNACFESSVLVDADLSRADLSNADFSNAFLNGANFCGATLKNAHFTHAELGRTLFVDTDLSSAVGLDDTRHSTSSEISFSTLIKSSFQLSEGFMRSAGMSIGLIDDLRRGQRFASDFSTCFLSYSTKDTAFAQQLYYALTEAGVRVYWDRTDLIAGEYLDSQLKQAILEHDRTIAILSENSVQSKWLEREVKLALYHKPTGFTPIRLCDIPLIQTFVQDKEIKPDIVELYTILDFAGWADKAEFARCRDLLLKSIRR